MPSVTVCVALYLAVILSNKNTSYIFTFSTNQKEENKLYIYGQYMKKKSVYFMCFCLSNGAMKPMTMHVETHYEQKESNDQQLWGMMSEQGMNGMGADGVGVDGDSRSFSGFWRFSVY